MGNPTDPIPSSSLPLPPNRPEEDRVVAELESYFQGDNTLTKSEWVDQFQKNPNNNLTHPEVWNSYGRNAINRFLGDLKDHPEWKVHRSVLGMFKKWEGFGVSRAMVQEILERQERE